MSVERQLEDQIRQLSEENEERSLELDKKIENEDQRRSMVASSLSMQKRIVELTNEANQSQISLKFKLLEKVATDELKALNEKIETETKASRLIKSFYENSISKFSDELNLKTDHYESTMKDLSLEYERLLIEKETIEGMTATDMEAFDKNQEIIDKYLEEEELKILNKSAAIIQRWWRSKKSKPKSKRGKKKNDKKKPDKK